MSRPRDLWLLLRLLRADFAPGALAHCFADPAQLQRLAWLASACLVSPALLPILRRAGLDDELPADFADYLAGSHQLNRERNATLIGEAAEVFTVLEGAGLHPVALKGLAALLTGLYPDPGERMLGDLDILVPAPEFKHATAALTGAGYVPTPGHGVDEQFYTNLHHGVPLIHPRRIGVVELHRRPLGSGRATAVLRSLAPDGPETVVHGGRRWAVPGASQWLAHVVLHHMVQDIAYYGGTMQLRPLLDAQGLATRISEPDWQRLDNALVDGGYGRQWAAFRAAAKGLLGLAPPVPPRFRVRGRLWYWR